MSSEEYSDDLDITITFQSPQGLTPILKQSDSNPKNVQVYFYNEVSVINEENRDETIPLVEEDLERKPLLSRAATKRRNAMLVYEEKMLERTISPEVLDELSRSGRRSPPPIHFISSHASTDGPSELHVKKGNLQKNGVEREVTLRDNTLYYSNKNMTGEHSVSLIGDITVSNTLPVTICLFFAGGKKLTFKTKTAFDTIEWTNAISLQIKKPDPVVEEWLCGFDDSSPMGMVVVQEEQRNKRKRKKKRRDKESEPISSDEKLNLRQNSADSPRAHRKKKKNRSGSHDDRNNILVTRRRDKIRGLKRSRSVEGEVNTVYTESDEKPKKKDFSSLQDAPEIGRRRKKHLGDINCSMDGIKGKKKRKTKVSFSGHKTSNRFNSLPNHSKKHQKSREYEETIKELDIIVESISPCQNESTKSHPVCASEPSLLTSNPKKESTDTRENLSNSCTIPNESVTKEIPKSSKNRFSQEKRKKN